MAGNDRGSREEPLRVGLVIGQLTYGGAESQLCELAHGLRRRKGCVVVVYCLSAKDQPYGDRMREAGIEVHTFPASRSFDVGRVRALAAALRRDRIELVHAFLFLASAYAYLATRLTRGTALVTSARNCKPEPHPLRRLVMRRAFASSQSIICNSRETERYAATHYGAPPALTHVVYNGVDTDRFAGPRVAHDGIRIGTVGRIEKQKNLDVFLTAAQGFLATYPNATFTIVGEGSLRGQVTAEVERRGLGQRVSLPGTRADVPGFLAGLDQFWLTSDYEGTPNVVLEAMAAGVPVVATCVGGTGEVIEDQRSGFLVEAGDGEGVLRAALRLAGDPRLADTMGRAAREEARARFSLPAMVEATRAVYDEALGERAAGGSARAEGRTAS